MTYRVNYHRPAGDIVGLGTQPTIEQAFAVLGRHLLDDLLEGGLDNTTMSVNFTRVDELNTIIVTIPTWESDGTGAHYSIDKAGKHLSTMANTPVAKGAVPLSKPLCGHPLRSYHDGEAKCGVIDCGNYNYKSASR